MLNTIVVDICTSVKPYATITHSVYLLILIQIINGSCFIGTVLVLNFHNFLNVYLLFI